MAQIDPSLLDGFENVTTKFMWFLTPGDPLYPGTTQEIILNDQSVQFILGNVETLTTDSGKELGQAMKVSTTIAGTAYAMWCFVYSTGAAWLATGWAIITAPIDIPAFIVAALGISAGTALYASFPNLFNKISNAIFGNFIDGLPVLYFNHEGKLCIDNDTLEKAKDCVLSEPQIYQSYGQPDPSSTGKVVNYIQNKFNQRNPIQIKEQLTLSQILELFDNGTDDSLFPYQLRRYLDENGYPTNEDTGITNPGYSERFLQIMEAWKILYASDTIISKQKRSNLLEFLNTYWSDTMNLSFYASGSYDYRRIHLISIEAINSILSLNLPQHLGYYINSIRRYLPVKVKWSIESNVFPASSGFSSDISVLVPGQRAGYFLTCIIDGNQTIGDRDFVDGDSHYVALDNGVGYADYSNGGNDFAFYENETSTELISDIPFSKWVYSYYRDSPRDLWSVQSKPVNGIPTTDTNFYDPSGNYFVQRRPYFQLAQYGFLGLCPDPYSTFGNNKYLGSIGMAEYYTNPTTRSWVLPNTTQPTTEPLEVTYPDWPTHQPSTQIGDVKEINPDTETQEDQAAKQETYPYPADLQKIIDALNKIASIIAGLTPQPQPDPEPDPVPPPGPTPDPPIIPNPPTPPNPDPPDPAPSPVPFIPDFDITDTFANNIFRVWNPTREQVNSLATYIWSSEWFGVIPNIWSDPLAPIISFKRVYATPQTDGTGTIWLGMNNTHVSGVKKVSNQYTRQTLGSIFIPETVGNATDYSPYTQMHLYIPFVGIQEVDVDDFMAKYISLRYTFDIYTGACLVEVFSQSSSTSNKQLLYAYTGNAAQEIPLSSATYQGLVNTIISIASTAVSAVAVGGMAAGMGAAGAGAGAGVGVDPFMASGAANSLGTLGPSANSIFHEMVHYGRSGSLQSNAGVMANRYPQIIISNRNRADAANYSSLYGYPANKSVYLGNLSGFNKIKAIQLGTFATQPEKAELELLLKGGVIF